MNEYAYQGNSQSKVDINITQTPNKCPFCYDKITANYIRSYIAESKVTTIYQCPGCKEYFFVWYDVNLNHGYTFKPAKWKKVMFGEPEPLNLAKVILELSPNFERIYKQAQYAEQHSLSEICGTGYRKAFEFLIKDYLIAQCIEYDENGEIINKDEDKIEKIKNENLGACIHNRIENPKIKEIAKRATWIGNDETHYVRVYDDRDIVDLKKLIELTLHWIESEIISNQFIEELQKVN